jgi:hypothetical protein
MQIIYAGKVSKDEFLQAIFLHNRKYRVSKWIMGFFLVLLIVSILILIIEGSIETKDLLRYLFPGILFPLIIMTSPWWIPFAQLLSFDQPGNIYRNTVFGQIDENEVLINSSNIKNSFLWSVFIKYQISNDILLLYLGKNNFCIFTKRMFRNQEDWNDFTSLIKVKVPVNRNHR